MTQRKSIPKVVVKDTLLAQLLNAVKEIVETGEGVRGDPLDRKLTVRDVVDAGLVKLRNLPRGRYVTSKELEPLFPSEGGEVDYTPPPMPTGVYTTSGIDQVFVGWDVPAYDSHKHDHVRLWRSTEDNFANAVVHSQVYGQLFVDPVPFQVLDAQADTIRGYFYWVQFVSRAGVAGPPHAVNGQYGEPRRSPSWMLEQLENKVKASHLHAELTSRIDLIDGPTSLQNSVAARLADEAAARNAEIIAAVGSEAATRGAAIQSESQARATADDALAAQVTVLQAQMNDLSFGAFDANAVYALGDKFRYDGAVYEVTTVPPNQPNPTPPNTNYYLLRTDIQSLSDAINANAQGIVETNVRVSNAENALTAQAGELAQYKTELTAVEQLQTDPYFIHGDHFYSTAYVGETVAAGIAGAIATPAGLQLPGGKWVYGRVAIPVTTARKYRVRARIKQLVDRTDGGGSKVYVGVVTLDSSYANITGGAGAHRYCAAAAQLISVADGEKVYEGVITGEGATHADFRPGTRYIRPVAIVNYGSDGTVQVSELSVEDVTDVLAVSESLQLTANEVAQQGQDITAHAEQLTLLESSLQAESNARTQAVQQLTSDLQQVDGEVSGHAQQLTQLQASRQGVNLMPAEYADFSGLSARTTASSSEHD